MINHYLGAALVVERHGILLAEAEAARQARSARPRRPRANTTVAPRPRLYQTPRWLRPARSQLPGLGRRSAPAGTQIVLRDGHTCWYGRCRALTPRSWLTVSPG
jgi:hypothetical protein